MRLIDADALKEAMNEHTDYKGYLVCDPEEIIDLAPTIEERPHGEWVWNTDNHNQRRYCKCSICGVGMGDTEYDFCPNCGADMRKEGDEK